MPITVGIAGLSGMTVVHEELFAEGLHDPEKFSAATPGHGRDDERAGEEAEMVREMRAASREAATPSKIDAHPEMGCAALVSQRNELR